MVHRCCISSCGMSVRLPEAKGLSYHKFPTKEPIRDLWVEAVLPHIDRPEAFKVVPRYTRVCSRHFRKKDYCIDAKKRARLNSNAFPSVFPRKNSPLVIPVVLPVSPKVTNLKPQQQHPSFDSLAAVATAGPSLLSHSLITSFTQEVLPNLIDGTQSTEIDANQLDSLLESGKLLIESATIQDDHLVLTVMDSTSQVELEAVSISNSDDQSQTAVVNKLEESTGTIRRRKRRKWNRTAFARPAKGKRKSTSSKPEPTVDDNLLEIGLNTSKKTEPFLDILDALAISTSDSPSDTLEQASLNNVTLLLPDLSSQAQVASVEQELLQSIQAVSLTCGGEEVEVEPNKSPAAAVVDSFSFSSLVPAFLHHHSSEESLFSSDESHNLVGLLETPGSTEVQQSLLTEDDSLRFELVDLRIDSDTVPPPTYLDIDELAHQLNSSLFTEGKLPLFNIESLNLSTEAVSELNIPDDLLIGNDSDSNSNSKTQEPTPTTAHKNSADSSKTVEQTNEPKQGGQKKGTSQRSRSRKSNEVKPVKNKKLKGVTKRPKKDKMVGRFSVERFKNSDKDIEYYTGFTTYRFFEAFFRSLEAYIERLCITDVNYGVNNLPTTNKIGEISTILSESSPCSSKTSPAELPKKRPCQGRAMSRINELFMTIIRLRRKLPEKVLGHMFCISQPTVSRVVRAWTVLLSKIIDSYPAESSLSSNCAYKEHSYTSKGLGIPDAFRELFYSDLAKSIVVTSLNPKKMKPSTRKQSPPVAQAHTVKKSKIEKPSCSKSVLLKYPTSFTLNSLNEDELKSELSDFLLDPDVDPTIDQLGLFDFI